MKTSLTPEYSVIFLPQVRLMVVRAKVCPGAENTATRRLVSEDTEHELGSLMTVLSPGLRNTVMFLVESQEMSGNFSGDRRK